MRKEEVEGGKHRKVERKEEEKKNVRRDGSM
jgi:hypothetical protein